MPGRSLPRRDESGGLSLCNFGFEKTGTLSSLFLRSCLARDLGHFGVVSLDRGTSSSLSVASGYFIGECFFLVGFSTWVLIFAGGPDILVWSERGLEGLGIGAPSDIAIITFLPLCLVFRDTGF